jgi:hypothetical protein
MLVFVLYGGWRDEIRKTYGNTMTNNVVYDRVRSFRTTSTLVPEEMKTIVNGNDTVRLRLFTVLIRCKTADCIVSVKLEKTAKYGPFTIRIQYGPYFCAR